MPDPYQLANGTLRNKLNETDRDRLAVAEFQLVSQREQALWGRGVSQPCTMATLQAIHTVLFQDVYYWAGDLRTINLTKAAFENSTDFTPFTPAVLLKSTMTRLDERLKNADYLRGLSKEEFLTASSNLFVGINNLHPFREGNGRTQRIFMRALAQGAGYDLDFDVVTKERMIVTSIAGAKGDNAPMRRLFEEISDPERVTALGRALGFLRDNTKTLGDMYLATTVAGQTYDATLVQRAFPDFMVRVDKPEPRIIIGHIDDLDETIERSAKFTFTPRRY